MNLKPIEPGANCLAFDPLLTGSQRCKAVEFYPAGKKINYKGFPRTFSVDCWRINRELKYVAPYVASEFVRAAFLIRIGDDENTETKARTEELTYD